MCDTASDGVMAENMLRTKEYDVVVTDLRMPRKHGHQLIVELLERRNPPLVVAVTGLSEPKLVVDLLERGVAEVVQKPLSHRVLAAKIRAMLRLRSGQPKAAHPDQSEAAKVADTIHVTTESLRAQLAQVTDTFQNTIKQLEVQKHQLEAGFLDSLRVLSSLVGQTGATQQSHVGRVEALAEALGELVGLSAERLRQLKFAALLHDIGQFGMPDRLRNKPPWQLEPEEMNSLKSYPFIGAALLSQVRGAEDVADIIEKHCENFDGSGFPKGLQGTQIPLEARILRVADGCDLFHMHCGDEEVVERLHEHLTTETGHAYDPEIAKLTSQILARVYRPADESTTQQCEGSQLRPGMVLAENVYDEHGHFLARQGARLTPQMIVRLQELVGRSQVMVNREAPAGRTPDAQ